MSVINRPETNFDGASHKYTKTATGDVLYGVSTVAKIGEAEDSFSIGSAWGFRIGYEGVNQLLLDSVPELAWGDPYDLRKELQARGLTPWATRDEAALRGNWAHDLLEALATDGTINIDRMQRANDERQGHARAILNWFIKYRPRFVATEVQVTSDTHNFAGRYDIRCIIDAKRLLYFADELKLNDQQREVIREYADRGVWPLCLVDLKTSKSIYPTSHYVQLEGYELAGVEMGFPPTDLRLVLNTRPDGTFRFEAGYAKPEHFLVYLEALKAIRYLKEHDPETIAKRKLEEVIISHLPALSAVIGRQPDVNLTGREVGQILGGLRKRGLVQQTPTKTWELVPVSTGVV